MGLPRWLSGKEPARQCRRFGFNPWVGKILWRRKWQPSRACTHTHTHTHTHTGIVSWPVSSCIFMTRFHLEEAVVLEAPW